MKRYVWRWVWAAKLITAGICFFGTVASAQMFHLGEWGGELESGSEYQRQATSTGSNESSRFQNILSENRLSVRNTGAYIYDPRLINLSLGGTLGFSQDWQSTNGDNRSQSGFLWGYDLFGSILPEKAFSLNFFANRNQSNLSGELAGRIGITAENYGATLLARQLYVPSTLTFRQGTQDQKSESGGITSRISERRNVLTYDGQRGWTDSEMSLHYELTDLTDKILPNLSYRSHDASLYYSLDFGPELNRRWDSKIHFLTRSGVADLTTLNLDELLRIDHTERLETDYRYSLLRIGTAGGETTTHTGEFHLRHQLYNNLTTNLNLGGSFQILPDGERDQYRSRLNFDYTKRLPYDGRLNVSLGGGLQFDKNRLSGTESFVPQETHTAGTPFALPIDLTNPFVISTSIVVTKIATGPLPIGCFPVPGPPTLLVLGQDYTVQTLGDITRIVPIPCSGITPGINPGDTIAVDYQFSVSPSLSYFTMPWHLNVSVDYRWIRPYFMHEQMGQKLVSGQDGRFLDNQRSDTLGTELRYEGQRLRTSILGEGRNYNSDRLAYNMLRSSQFLAYTITPNLLLTLNGDESFSFFSRPRQDIQTLNGRATLSYMWGGTLFMDAFVGIRALMETGLPNERITETGLRVRWIYRNVEVLPSVEFFDRQRGNADTKNFHMILRLIRRF
ncbi:MAG: hypothetical protein ACM3TN_04410 [Alphaproteobacteria bacterium]